MVLRTDNNEADFLLRFFMDNSARVVDAVKARFGDRMITLEDEEGDGEIISVDDVDLDAESIIQVSDGRAVLELSAEVSFTASISYGFDGHFGNHKMETLERTITVPVEVSMEYRPSGHLDYRVTNILLNRDEPVSIYVDEDAETHWK